MSAFDVIPAELRGRDQWVIWRDEQRDGKTTKVPYRADGAGRASSTDRTTWAPFSIAVSGVSLFGANGIGYVFTAADPYCGVDLDLELAEADRAAIALKLASYTEESVSGGWHVIVRASLNGRGRHPQGLGVFDSGRYFVFTGRHVTGTPTTIEERQTELEAVLAEYLPKSEPVAREYERKPIDLDDQELLERAFAARNGDKFQRLWEGDWSGYSSQSEADLALAMCLAYWTGRDPGRIDNLFRASGLMRPKWEREDYRRRTIEAAIAGTSAAYEGRSGRSRGSDSADSVTWSRGTGDGYGVAESAFIDSATPDAPIPVTSEKGVDGVDSDSDAESVDSVFSLTLREFIARERESRDPLLASVDGWAVVGARSLTLLGALGGHGKTTISIDLFLHMAAGVDYLPWTVPRPVSILLIENEGPEELFAEKLAARLEHFPHELKARLDVCTLDWGGFSLANDCHRETLTREIAEKGYDLIFGDPLDALGIEGVGSPEDTRKFLELMKQTGLNKTVAWWLNTHPRKEETKEALNEISGAWGGKPDSVFLLRLLGDDRTQLRQPKLRWARRGKGPTLLFAFDPDTEAFSYVGEQSEEERDYVAETVSLLSDGTWRIVKEIAAPTEAGGIAANEKVVKRVLEQHPDLFESRTGDDAKALGRSSQATLWQLRTEAP